MNEEYMMLKVKKVNSCSECEFSKKQHHGFVEGCILVELNLPQFDKNLSVNRHQQCPLQPIVHNEEVEELLSDFENLEVEFKDAKLAVWKYTKPRAIQLRSYISQMQQEIEVNDNYLGDLELLIDGQNKTIDLLTKERDEAKDLNYDYKQSLDKIELYHECKKYGDKYCLLIESDEGNENWVSPELYNIIKQLKSLGGNK